MQLAPFSVAITPGADALQPCLSIPPDCAQVLPTSKHKTVKHRLCLRVFLFMVLPFLLRKQLKKTDAAVLLGIIAL